jgi:hypothetical protein
MKWPHLSMVGRDKAEGYRVFFINEKGDKHAKTVF